MRGKIGSEVDYKIVVLNYLRRRGYNEVKEVRKRKK